MFKPLPRGIDDFKKVIENDFYYVDKTLLIKDVLDDLSEVQLFTRPRRFGKSLNMSMLKYYFELSDANYSHLFDNLDISKQGEKYSNHARQYPVIFLSLKEIKGRSFDSAFGLYKILITREFSRHSYVLNSGKLDSDNRSNFSNILEKTADYEQVCNALNLLSQCLHQATGKQVIILIDEYDVPLQHAYFNDYYDDMTKFISVSFGAALKSNTSLMFGILTGCLRISKESIFTGLNNPTVNSVLTLNKTSERFGFTKPEVVKLVEDYNLTYKLDEVKDWYDGYIFGETEIYNPWSVINYVKAAVDSPKAFPEPYWFNTSSNDIIRKMIEDDLVENLKDDIETLLDGNSITKRLYENITYRDLDNRGNYIWSFLVATGYLKPIRQFQDSHDYRNAELVIPNKEVYMAYRENIQLWTEDIIRKNGTRELFDAVITGNVETFENELNRWLLSCISFYDNKEYSYHMFLLGLLTGYSGYQVKSNRETGSGRTDITICKFQTRELAVILELKYASKFTELDSKCDEALKQIEDKNYAGELIADGYTNILKYSVAFAGKACKVKKVEN